MKRSIDICCAAILLAIATSIAAEGLSPERARRAVEGVIEGAGPALSPNFGAPFVLPDTPVPLPPGVKPAWEGQLDQWLKDLGNDDAQVREKATQEMLKEQDPGFEERLKSLLPKQSDPEIKARLGMVIEEFKSPSVRELEKKLSERLLNASHLIAKKALSNEEKDLQEALKQMMPSADANNRLQTERLAASKEDVEILFPAIMGSLERIEPDITKLDGKTKRLLWALLQFHLRTVKEHAPYIEGLLKDAEPLYRGYAITFLSALRPDAKTADEAVAMLNDPNHELRSFAVDALSDMKAKEREPEILRLLDDPALITRESCVRFLKRQAGPGDQKALDGVSGRLDDAEEQVAFAAVDALSEWGKLDETLLASRPKTGTRIIGLLVKWGRAKEYSKTLEALTKHPDPSVAQAANQALGR